MIISSGDIWEYDLSFIENAVAEVTFSIEPPAQDLSIEK